MLLSLSVTDMISVGLEYVPLSGIISLDGNSVDSRAEVSDFMTAYLMLAVDAGPGKLYGKVGYADAQIGTVTANDSTTVNSQSDALEGPMLGIGFQTAEGALGDALDLVARIEATYTDLVKQDKIAEIQGLEQRIQAFQQNAQNALQQKEQELLEPILSKARAAIEDVAKEGNFTYIFDSSMGSILYADESENVMALVKKKLGL